MSNAIYFYGTIGAMLILAASCSEAETNGKDHMSVYVKGFSHHHIGYDHVKGGWIWAPKNYRANRQGEVELKGKYGRKYNQSHDMIMVEYNKWLGGTYRNSNHGNTFVAGYEFYGKDFFKGGVRAGLRAGLMASDHKYELTLNNHWGPIIFPEVTGKLGPVRLKAWVSPFVSMVMVGVGN